jgi:hypothetical protein
MKFPIVLARVPVCIGMLICAGITLLFAIPFGGSIVDYDDWGSASILSGILSFFGWHTVRCFLALKMPLTEKPIDKSFGKEQAPVGRVSAG